jgi:hypothetical protein
MFLVGLMAVFLYRLIFPFVRQMMYSSIPARYSQTTNTMYFANRSKQVGSVRFWPYPPILLACWSRGRRRRPLTGRDFRAIIPGM